MSKPNTSLEDLVPSRMAARPLAIPASDDPPTTRRRQPSRAKTVMIAGHFDADVSFAVHELCGRLTRQKGCRVTVQQALAEALTDWFTKNGATPPKGLDLQVDK
jgi:hypothetical protein